MKNSLEEKWRTLKELTSLLIWLTRSLNPDLPDWEDEDHLSDLLIKKTAILIW